MGAARVIGSFLDGAGRLLLLTITRSVPRESTAAASLSVVHLRCDAIYVSSFGILNHSNLQSNGGDSRVFFGQPFFWLHCSLHQQLYRILASLRLLPKVSKWICFRLWPGVSSAGPDYSDPGDGYLWRELQPSDTNYQKAKPRAGETWNVSGTH